MKQRVFFAVTNDLNYDQRMIRICTSMAAAGFAVTLVGRANRDSQPLADRPFCQHRLKMWFRRGKLFYLEYHCRLLIYLLRQQMEGICAVDLDTILPCYWVSRIRRIPRFYDAHELFCEMKEVVERPMIRRIWKAVERCTVPGFPQGYTVSCQIAGEFQRLYGVEYAIVRNAPLLEEPPDPPPVAENSAVSKFPGLKAPRGRYILYQGAVNEGRCFESLIPAMLAVDAPLVICGIGNFMEQARELVRRYGLHDKITFRGAVRPEELKAITKAACCGVTLFDRRGLSNYYSLANRFFDYMHAGIPQVAMNYPAYSEINNSYPVAVLIDEPGVRQVSDALNELLNNPDLYNTLSEGCKRARLRYNWQEEEQVLVQLYQRVFS